MTTAARARLMEQSNGQRTVPQIFVGRSARRWIHRPGRAGPGGQVPSPAVAAPDAGQGFPPRGAVPSVRWEHGGIRTMADIHANTPDPLYDLVGTLYHALKQAAAAERHAADARAGTRHRARRAVPGRARAIARPRARAARRSSPAGWARRGRPRPEPRGGGLEGELPRQRRTGVLSRGARGPLTARPHIVARLLRRAVWRIRHHRRVR